MTNELVPILGLPALLAGIGFLMVVVGVQSTCSSGNRADVRDAEARLTAGAGAGFGELPVAARCGRQG